MAFCRRRCMSLGKRPTFAFLDAAGQNGSHQVEAELSQSSAIHDRVIPETSSKSASVWRLSMKPDLTAGTDNDALLVHAVKRQRSMLARFACGAAA